MHNLMKYAMAMFVGAVLVGSIAIAINVNAQYEPTDPVVMDTEIADIEPAGPGEVSAIQNILSYQGQLLTAGGTPVNGIQPITFRLYLQSQGGTAVWGQVSSVTVSNGWFTALLGDQPQTVISDDLLDGRDIWLGVQVGNDPEMTPRQQIRAAAYAVNARMLDGQPASNYLAARRGPIAYGVVNEGGGRESGWHFTSEWESDRYEITLEVDGDDLNYDAEEFTTVVTPMAGNDICDGEPSLAMTNSDDGRLLVFIQGLDGDFKQCPFHFMTIQNNPSN